MVNNLITISTYRFQGWTKIPTKISTYHINKQQKSLLPFANPYISLCKFFNLVPITFVSAYFDLSFVNLKGETSIAGSALLTIKQCSDHRSLCQACGLG
ncbi:hypothetical protein AHAS_Ahas06G0074700 [Arachis hypogaea]